MDLSLDLKNERSALREEILSVGAILAEHQLKQQELAKLTEKYQTCENMEERASIAVRVMDLRITIDAEGVDNDALEARIDEAFANYDNALMDALIAAEPQPDAATSNGYTQREPSPTRTVASPYNSGLPTITNKCPLCEGYKRAEFDYCRDCYMRRNPDEFDNCECGRSKHVRYEMCGACHYEEQARFV